MVAAWAAVMALAASCSWAQLAAMRDRADIAVKMIQTRSKDASGGTIGK